jgi:small subunit ribosomal protein S16
MALKIRLQRHGATHRPFYRMVVTEATARRDGRFVEVLGTYEPQASKPENELLLKLERIDYWKSVGAKATDTAASLIRRAIRGPELVAKKKKNKKAEPAPTAAELEAEAPAEEATATEAEAEAPAEEATATEAEAPAEAEASSGPDCGCGKTQDANGKCDGSHAKKEEAAPEAVAEAEAEAPAEAEAEAPAEAEEKES